MDLEVGMYIRTKKGIAKIKKIFSNGNEPYFEAKYETDTYLEIYYDSQYVSKYDVLKASYNIIDILEVGDYVNGFEVLRIDKECNLYPKTLKCQYPNNIDYFDMFDEDIKSVVTHEQIEQMAYKVGE